MKKSNRYTTIIALSINTTQLLSMPPKKIAPSPLKRKMDAAIEAANKRVAEKIKNMRPETAHIQERWEEELQKREEERKKYAHHLTNCSCSLYCLNKNYPTLDERQYSNNHLRTQRAIAPAEPIQTIALPSPTTMQKRNPLYTYPLLLISTCATPLRLAVGYLAKTCKNCSHRKKESL